VRKRNAQRLTGHDDAIAHEGRPTNLDAAVLHGELEDLALRIPAHVEARAGDEHLEGARVEAKLRAPARRDRHRRAPALDANVGAARGELVDASLGAALEEHRRAVGEAQRHIALGGRLDPLLHEAPA